MLFLKICGGSWENASRDKRELSVYQEMGYDVAVLAKGEEKDRGRTETVDGFRVYRYTTKPCGRKIPAAVNRVISLFAWAKFAKSLHPDVISGHDMMPGLTIGWLAGKLSLHKPKLIYDSHEFEIGRNSNRKTSTDRFIRRWEKFLIKRSAFMIVVNQSIAEAIQSEYNLTETPVVLRSIPPRWSVDRKACEEQRAEFIDGFGEKGIQKIIMFHGNLGDGNGIEDIIPILGERKWLGLVLLGKKTDEGTYNRILSIAEQHHVTGQMLIHPAVNIDELWRFSGAADIEMMPIVPIVKSYYFVLPNKLFEAIQAETPVIASDLPEMRRLVDEYGIGLICKPGDTGDIGKCVDQMVTDKKLYAACKENIIKAKQDLCWENEKQFLIEAVNRWILN